MCEEIGIFVVGVDDGVLSFFKKFEFGFAIVFEGFVVIEMVVGEIGENGDFDRDAEGTELRHGVGGDFKDEEFGTGVGNGAHTSVKDTDAFGSHVFVLRMQLMTIKN